MPRRLSARVLQAVIVLTLASCRPPGLVDSDGDGLRDAVEAEPTSLSDPHRFDSDGDGLHDGLEVTRHTNPADADTDGDALTDGREDANQNGLVDTGETDPRRADSDADGLNDGVEDSNLNGLVDRGETDPNLRDSDADGLGDGLEDSNQNGRNDVGETNPRLADSDGDLVDDGVEDVNQNGRQDGRESSPLVADLSPTHTNDVLGVPEPLLTDWVRALGARAGELEVNTLATIDGQGDWELAPEIEWVPVNGVGLEGELVVTHAGLAAVKLAAQFTLVADAARGLGHGVQLIGKWTPQTPATLVAMHLFQQRLSEQLSLGLMTGAELAWSPVELKSAFLAHPTFSIRLHPRVALVTELNTRFADGRVDLALVPHVRVDVPHLGSAQLGAGATIQLSAGPPAAGLVVAARVTWER
ncbi:MAG: hypothetical protein Q8L14_36950 [Myxococcales bacterium]|nr:hypothetical protein [Myxococcales bacterium]